MRSWNAEPKITTLAFDVTAADVAFIYGIDLGEHEREDRDAMESAPPPLEYHTPVAPLAAAAPHRHSRYGTLLCTINAFLAVVAVPIGLF